MTLPASRNKQLKTELIEQLQASGFTTDDTNAILGDDLEYPLYLNLINASTVMCQFGYAAFSYGDNVKSKRDSIKTAKDICEFYHSLAIRKDPSLPELRLLYRNSTNGRWVAVTHHVMIDYNDLYFNGAEMIQNEINKMNILSRLIEKDIESNEDAIWDKGVLVPKKWWRH